MALFGAGGFGQSALDAFLSDPNLRELWFDDSADRSAVRALLEERAKPRPTLPEEQEEAAQAQAMGEGASEPLLRLEISPDAMRVWVIIRELSRDITPEMLSDMIYDELEREKVSYGIKRQQISRISRSPLYGKPLLVATGKLPKENMDGAIAFQFKKSEKLEPNALMGYGVDWENPDFVNFVKAGALLCTSNGSSNDFTGKNIYGRVIRPLNGGLDEIEIGENVRMSADGTKWYSLTDGEVILSGGKLSVLPVVRIDNVDVSTGDIHYHGSVYVRGNVELGRKVEATANVIVGGVVQNGTVIAGGHLAVGGGIKGAENTYIQVGGSLRTPFVEYMKTTVAGDIYADVLLGAHVRCEGGIYALGKRGRIVSGHCAAREIVAKELGNSAGAKTMLEIVGTKDMEDKIFLMREELASWHEREEKMCRVIQETGNTVRRQALERILEQIKGQKTGLMGKLDKLQYKADQARVVYSLEIRVKKELNPKVSCKISGLTLYNENHLLGVRVYYAGGKIRLSGYSA